TRFSRDWSSDVCSSDLEILAQLALRQPLLLVIDDLQWSDLDSLSLLQDLLMGPEAPNCMVLATGRPCEQLGPELKEALTELLSEIGRASWRERRYDTGA